MTVTITKGKKKILSRIKLKPGYEIYFVKNKITMVGFRGPDDVQDSNLKELLAIMEADKTKKVVVSLEYRVKRITKK